MSNYALLEEETSAPDRVQCIWSISYALQFFYKYIIIYHYHEFTEMDAERSGSNNDNWYRRQQISFCFVCMLSLFAEMIKYF